MGLGYFFILLTMVGGSVCAVLLLKSAREIWNKARQRWLVIVPLALGLLCAYWALFALYIFWREPPWLFF